MSTHYWQFKEELKSFDLGRLTLTIIFSKDERDSSAPAIFVKNDLT